MPFVPIPFTAIPRTAAAVPVGVTLSSGLSARVAGQAGLGINRVDLPEVEHAADAGAGEGGSGREKGCGERSGERGRLQSTPTSDA